MASLKTISLFDFSGTYFSVQHTKRAPFTCFPMHFLIPWVPVQVPNATFCTALKDSRVRAVRGWRKKNKRNTENGGKVDPSVLKGKKVKEKKEEWEEISNGCFMFIDTRGRWNTTWNPFPWELIPKTCLRCPVCLNLEQLIRETFLRHSAVLRLALLLPRSWSISSCSCATQF